MVVGLILEIGIRASVWCIYKTYQGIHYLYYGPQETAEDRIIREIKLLKQENTELRHSLLLDKGDKADKNKSDKTDKPNQDKTEIEVSH